MDSTVTGPSSWRTGEVIDGRYKVLTVLGHGGMGVVHRVRHQEWGIDLAVKSPRPDLFRHARDRELFVDEAEVWESLGLHPNVCGCHYVRMLDGVPRVFAEYVAGGSLAEWIADRRLYAGERPAVLARILDLAIQMAWGLEHAHSRGLVHQDVKPANVLLEVSAGSALTAKVTDFGLARARAVATSAAEHGAPAGVSILVTSGGMTLAYASPEQAGKARVGRRSDIYSLAVSVLEMFTGGVTWRAGSAAGAALAAHRAGPPRDPGLPELPAEVAALLERCLHHEPEHPRPGSMAAVAGELAEIYRQVVGHAYPRARPVAAELRADELNNRGLSLLDLGRQAEAAEAFEAAIAADPRHLEATYNDGLRQWRSGAITDDALIRRLEGARTASGDSWLARYLLAEVHLERGGLIAAHELLCTLEGVAPERPEVATALRTVRSELPADSRRVKTRKMSWHEYEGPGIPSMEIRFTADGRRALAVSGEHVGLWDVHGGRRLVRLSGQQGGPHIDVSADGRFALCGSETRVRLWDLTSGRELWKARTRAPSYVPINAVSLSADARIAATVLSTVVASSDRDNVMIWDARTGRLRLRLGEHAGYLAVELSPDGRYVLTSDDRTARLWDTGTGACVRELPRDDAGVSAMSLSADVRTAAVARSNIGIWDLTTGRQIRTLTGHTRPVRSLSWSSDGRFLLSGADDDTVRLWEPGSGRCLRTFPITSSGPWPQAVVLLEPDTGRPMAATADMVRWWPLPRRYSAPPRLSRPRRHAELTRLDADATALVDAAERAIAARRHTEARDLLTKARAIRGYERDPRLLSAWRSLAGVLPRVGVLASWQVREFTGYSHSAVDLSPDGARAASGDYGTLRVWDTRTGRCLREIAYPASLTAVRLSHDQRRVLCANFGGQLGVWSIDTGDCLMKITRQENEGASWTYFTADGRWALSRAYKSIRLWDLDSGRCVRTVTSQDGFSAGWLSPDGRRAVTGVLDQTVRVWDMGTGECLHALAGHQDRIGSVSLSSAGDLAVSSGDRTIRLWDVASGTCLHVLHDLPDVVRSVRFVCDGRFLMSAGTTGAIRVWDPRTGRCLHTFDTGQGEVRIEPTPDGRFALSSGGDATLRLWEFDWDLGTSTT